MSNTPPRSFLFSLLDTIAGIVDGINQAWRKCWRWFADGILQHIVFYLLLLISGIVVIISAVCEELDRYLARLEKGLISLFMLVMVGLSFLDYMRRELSFFDFEIDGGPNMAVVLMVWVGFLGASLAVRQKKHLAVDATDRILSPAAARLAKRFTALTAAVFCWKFGGYAMALITDSLRTGAGQDALPLWDSLRGPVNWVGQTLLPIEETSNLTIVIWTTVVLIFCYGMRVYRDQHPDTWKIRLFEGMGGLLVLLGGLSLLSWLWNPTESIESSERLSFEPIAETAVNTNVDAAELDEIANLVGGDTGEEEALVEPAEDLQAFVESSSGGIKFPLWLAQSIIPLSFFLMAIRFLALGLSARFDPYVEEDESENSSEDEPVSHPPAPFRWVRSAGGGPKDLIFAGLFPGFLLGLAAILGVSTGWLIFIGAILLALVGAPLFLVIGVATVACVSQIQGIDVSNIAKDMYEAVKKEELLAIPFFVLAGNIMTEGAIAERLVKLARAVMGRTPSGLGLASIFACVIFAAISGSSPVTVIAVGSIMFPMLVKERYPENFSLGVLTSAGSLGIIIPPSVPMIIYAIMVSQSLQVVGKDMIDPESGLLPGDLDPSVLLVSPNDLFIAGVLPGLFIAGALAFFTLYRTRPSLPDIDIIEPEIEGSYWGNVIRELKHSWLSMLLPVLILGGIYGVLGPLKFTVTEAAAVAVVYALLVELVLHRFTEPDKSKLMQPSQLPNVLAKSGVMMGSLFLIIVLAIAFNKFLSAQMIPQAATELITSSVSQKWQFLILVNLFLLALGCIMDIISAILIVAPLLAPIAMSYGIHPLHFGIMFIVNLELGYLTPPLGINLFVSSTVFNRPVVDVIRATVPFLILMLFCLAVIVALPWLSIALV
ncbi:MAG: TRAP transporter large permease subunit [Myxococcota bacterium]|nr:TRAP transporter large permease subunit [Myxococcota bacterium]